MQQRGNELLQPSPVSRVFSTPFEISVGHVILQRLFCVCVALRNELWALPMRAAMINDPRAANAISFAPCTPFFLSLHCYVEFINAALFNSSEKLNTVFFLSGRQDFFFFSYKLINLASFCFDSWSHDTTSLFRAS